MYDPGKPINIGIIEDSPTTLKSIQMQVERHFPDDPVVFTIEIFKEAKKAISEHQPDLVILDVNLPDKHDAFKLLDSLSEINFQIIFMTGVAIDEFSSALNKYPVINYLLKPVYPDLLQQAIKKAKLRIRELRELKALKEHLNNKTNKRHPDVESNMAISFPLIKGKIVVVHQQDIVKCESDGDLTFLCLAGENKGELVVNKSLKHCEEMLNAAFYRVHRQYLVNLAYVKDVHRKPVLQIELINGTKVPLARRRKEDFLKELRRYKSVQEK